MEGCSLSLGRSQTKTMKPFLQPGRLEVGEAHRVLLAHAGGLTPAEVPRFLGALKEIQITAFARLTAPVPAPSQLDKALKLKEAADCLGMSRRTLYKKHSKPPYGALKCPSAGRNVMFSAAKIAQYLKQRSLD